jgi:hypothetical protein
LYLHDIIGYRPPAASALDSRQSIQPTMAGSCGVNKAGCSKSRDENSKNAGIAVPGTNEGDLFTSSARMDAKRSIIAADEAALHVQAWRLRT